MTPLVIWTIQQGARAISALAAPPIDLPPISEVGPWVFMILFSIDRLLGGSRKALAQAVTSLASVQGQVAELRKSLVDCGVLDLGKRLDDSGIFRMDQRTGLFPAQQVNLLTKILIQTDEFGNPKPRLDLAIVAGSIESNTVEVRKTLKFLATLAAQMEARLEGLEDYNKANADAIQEISERMVDLQDLVNDDEETRLRRGEQKKR